MEKYTPQQNPNATRSTPLKRKHCATSTIATGSSTELTTTTSTHQMQQCVQAMPRGGLAAT